MRQTIAAVATREGRAAIGIIRLSGPDAVAAAGAVFRPESGRALGACPPRVPALGTLHDREGRPIDHALAFRAAAPRSYTGEDTVELHCHGSPMALALAMEALLTQNGVRQAEPGEFTRRAVLAGKLDLAQAEAVIDLIDAETPAGVRASAGQLAGSLSRRAGEIYDGLVDLMAHFHAVLDYPDEEIDDLRAETIRAALDRARTGLAALTASYERGRQLVRGVPCAIVGRPNAGKSSLLNALLGFERAIVTASPGTTRDTIEERCTLGGVLLRLIDTAGLRDTAEEAERLGVARSRAALADAALALLVIDGAVPLGDEDWAAMAAAEAAPHVICVVNKSDRGLTADMNALGERFSHVCVVSALHGEGLDTLAATVAALFPAGQAEETGALLTNPRQFAAAARAAEHVEAAQAGESCGVPPDALLTDVELALQALGELTGRTVREDVIGRVFERFCVGK